MHLNFKNNANSRLKNTQVSLNAFCCDWRDYFENCQEIHEPLTQAFSSLTLSLFCLGTQCMGEAMLNQRLK